MTKIKRCPFCGGIAKTFHNPSNTEEERNLHPSWQWRHPDTWVIGCSSDFCIGNISNYSMIFFSEESAIETWNMRAD